MSGWSVSLISRLNCHCTRTEYGVDREPLPTAAGCLRGRGVDQEMLSAGGRWTADMVKESPEERASVPRSCQTVRSTSHTEGVFSTVQCTVLNSCLAESVPRASYKLLHLVCTIRSCVIRGKTGPQAMTDVSGRRGGKWVSGEERVARSRACVT